MAINFWLADSYNIFVTGDHTQSNAGATGMVWVGQTATYQNYDVGAALPVAKNIACLQVLGNMNITGGINYSQNSAIDKLGTVTKYTMTNANGVTGQPVLFEYRPYDIYGVPPLDGLGSQPEAPL
ncbi:MAG: choice-of-anchor A family protein [Lachnospiraceae bacterium]